MHLVIVIILILAILLVIFTLQNSIEIPISFFFWEIPNAPLVLVLISCVVIGYLVAAIYFYPRLWKLKRENNKLERNSIETASQDEIESNMDDFLLDEDDDKSNSFFKD